MTPTINAIVSQIVTAETSEAAAAATLAECDHELEELVDYLSQALYGQADFRTADQPAPWYEQIVSEPREGICTST